MSAPFRKRHEGALDDLLDDRQAPMAEVEAAAAREAKVSDTSEFGRPGPPVNRRAPFWAAMAAAFGVGVAFIGAWAIYASRQILLDLGVSLFVAAGLDPVVSWLQRRGIPRAAAVLAVLAAGVALFAGIVGLAVPVVVRQVTQLVDALPHYAHELSSRSSFLGRVNARYHLLSTLQRDLTNSSGQVATGVLGVGRIVLGTLVSTVIVVVLSIYILVDLPRVKRTLWQLAPRSRRARTVLLGDEIFAKVGGYLLGNLAISAITGAGTWAWCAALGVPYPLLLAVMVAVFDLVPVIGSTVGGIIVALVALTVSSVVAAATAVFYIVYRIVEDYVLSPRIMRRTVHVPGLVTVVATLLGGAMLGVIGALIAIPVAAGIKLLLEEVAAPSLDQS